MRHGRRPNARRGCHPGAAGSSGGTAPWEWGGNMLKINSNFSNYLKLSPEKTLKCTAPYEYGGNMLKIN